MMSVIVAGRQKIIVTVSALAKLIRLVHSDNVWFIRRIAASDW
jgi:hypothetical protein